MRRMTRAPALLTAALVALACTLVGHGWSTRAARMGELMSRHHLREPHWYLAVLGTDPRLTDTDGDRIPDGLEQRYRTNPQVADDAVDSDSDGIVNLQEVAGQSDPLAADARLSGNRPTLSLKSCTRLMGPATMVGKKRMKAA